MFRYVFYFLIVYEEGVKGYVVDLVLETSVNYGSVLMSTSEQPKDETLQFLDLLLLAQANHLCWSFSPMSKKDILPHTSSHSKLVTTGIAISILGFALAIRAMMSLRAAVDLSFNDLKSLVFLSSPNKSYGVLVEKG